MRDCTQPPSDLPTAAMSAAALRLPRPHTNWTIGAIQEHCVTRFRSTPTWLTAVTMTCSTVCMRASLLTAVCSVCSGRLRISWPAPQSEDSTASGSSRLRARPTALRTWSPCSLMSCAASGVLAHKRATASDANLMSMRPASRSEMNCAFSSIMTSYTAFMSCLSCQLSRPEAPMTMTCGSCCTMKSRTRLASRSLRGFWNSPRLVCVEAGRPPRPLSCGRLRKSTMWPLLSTSTAAVAGPASRRLPPGPHTTAITRTSSTYSSESFFFTWMGGAEASFHSWELYPVSTSDCASASSCARVSRTIVGHRCSFTASSSICLRIWFHSWHIRETPSEMYSELSLSITSRWKESSGTSSVTLMSPSDSAILMLMYCSEASNFFSGLFRSRFTTPYGWNGSSTSSPRGVGSVETHACWLNSLRTACRTAGSDASSMAAMCCAPRRTLSALSKPGTSLTCAAAISMGDTLWSSGSCFLKLLSRFSPNWAALNPREGAMAPRPARLAMAYLAVLLDALGALLPSDRLRLAIESALA
mmetsp:Transcript_2182/g.5562  ORF Transcript_2182/g.5562 Transcript_2182/m.5562 type:complete len:530 (+) Transcript_2182:2034-3623(+)